mmetsp:Transcript_10354/g.21205  ORF Transcript_10354/g.21205 Transcript_10354/m.21205 type:complete len:216 (+) Transcript_10354:1036-1683(+)
MRRLPGLCRGPVGEERAGGRRPGHHSGDVRDFGAVLQHRVPGEADPGAHCGPVARGRLSLLHRGQVRRRRRPRGRGCWLGERGGCDEKGVSQQRDGKQPARQPAWQRGGCALSLPPALDFDARGVGGAAGEVDWAGAPAASAGGGRGRFRDLSAHLRGQGHHGPRLLPGRDPGPPHRHPPVVPGHGRHEGGAELAAARRLCVLHREPALRGRGRG